MAMNVDENYGKSQSRVLLRETRDQNLQEAKGKLGIDYVLIFRQTRQDAT